MTKDEELKLLDQIEELIVKAGADSYIALTFKGVPDVCRNNIRDDFGDSPVMDLDEMRNRYYIEVRNHEQTQKILRDTQEIAKQSVYELESANAELKRVVEERGAMVDSVNGLNELLDNAEAEIRKLKAEIVRMRMEHMSEDAIAEMYDRMGGDFDD